jgi:hypothetical protein
MDRVLKSWEVSLTKLNCETYDRLFRVCIRRCANPECDYPLSALVENFYSVTFEGKVCDLCHTLEDAANQQPGLREAHKEWKKIQDEKKRIIQNSKY